MRKNCNPQERTICLDCLNATNPDVCPWANDLTPVPGWDAQPTVVGNVYSFTSYFVRSCPLFVRESYSGGLKEDIFGKTREVHIDDKDTVKLASAIWTRAVEDWKFLQYGALQSIPYYGDRLYRDELLEFFFSEWATKLLECFSERTPEQIRKAIRITEDMRPEPNEGGKRRKHAKAHV